VSAGVPGGPDLPIFVQLAEQAGCRVVRCGEADVADADWWEGLLAVQTTNGDHAAHGTVNDHVAVGQSLVAHFPDAARLLQGRGAICIGDPARLVSCAVGVSACAAAVAETGSLLLAGAEPGDRLVWLLPPRCVLLVRAGDVLPSLDDAMAWLGAHPAAGVATLVTGPSRTSDVERVLTIGVQGPREVIVAVVAGSGD
jgi:L-lactate dehydrogenase complex protein LldG